MARFFLRFLVSSAAAYAALANKTDPLEATSTQVFASNETANSSESFTRLKAISDIMYEVLKYYSVFIIVFGTLLNLINFACFYRMKKRNSQNVYLSALSLAELYNIQINILIPLLKSMYPVLIQKIKESKWNVIICTVDGYLVEVGLLLPVWMMVLLAFERFLCIMWPLRKNNFATPKHAKKVLTILITVILIWSMYKIETAGIENESTFFQYSSKLQPDFICKKVTRPTLVNISTTMWAIVPVLLCLVLNILIIKKIKVTTSPHKKFYPSERCKKINQTTRLVISLSIIFVVLICPTGILIITDFIVNGSDEVLFDEEHQKQIETILIIMIWRKIALILYETYMIINLPIYLYTIKNFRQQLRNLFTSITILKRKNSIEIGIKNLPSKRLLENKNKNLQISIMLSLKRENKPHDRKESSVNEPPNAGSSSAAHKRNKLSSNSNSSIQSSSNANLNSKRRKRNKTYRLRVSFQKCSNDLSHANANSDLEQSKPFNKPQEVSLHRNDSFKVSNSINNNSNIYNSTDMIDKIKVFFAKTKQDSVSLLAAQDEPTTKFISKITNNSEKLNSLYYD